MMGKNRPVLYLLCIIAGAVLVFTGQGSEDTEGAPYLMIIGFIVLMAGLYLATTRWVKDNPKEKKEERDAEQ